MSFFYHNCGLRKGGFVNNPSSQHHFNAKKGTIKHHDCNEVWMARRRKKWRYKIVESLQSFFPLIFLMSFFWSRRSKERKDRVQKQIVKTDRIHPVSGDAKKARMGYQWPIWSDAVRIDGREVRKRSTESHGGVFQRWAVRVDGSRFSCEILYCKSRVRHKMVSEDWH